VSAEAPFWVALDAMGVLYRQRGIAAVVSRICAGHGLPVSETAAREAYRRASRGVGESPALWAALGLPAGEAGALDAEVVAGRSLMPGAGDFLAAMRAEGIGVGCITNDLGAWSAAARRAHDLDARIEPWVVSAEVGIRKPAQEIYQLFVAASGCDPARCLVVDDALENLEAARRLGFATAWFVAADPPGREGPAGQHRRVESFAELTACVTGTRAAAAAR
jgi:HAD superfamily hydrolase (TIGR01509 family)